MKNRKMACWLVLAIVMVFSSCSQKYDDENDFKVAPLTDGKSVKITGYVGKKQTVRIPPKLQGMLVTEIEGAFKGTDILSITIPNSVTSIGDMVFDGCTSLTSVTIEATITANKFSNYYSFPGDLRAKYLTGGIGTYTRPSSESRTWTKQ